MILALELRETLAIPWQAYTANCTGGDSWSVPRLRGRGEQGGIVINAYFRSALYIEISIFMHNSAAHHVPATPKSPAYEGFASEARSTVSSRQYRCSPSQTRTVCYGNRGLPLVAMGVGDQQLQRSPSSKKPNREKFMHATILPMPVSQLPIARIRSTHDLFALVPREIRRLLLIVDPASQPEPALTLALEIAERWGSHITLVHPGRLSGWQATAEEAAETAMIDLLCLSWEVKGRYGEVSISQTMPTSLPEVLDEAAERKVDLILLPEPLAAQFRHPQLTTTSGGRGVCPCPIVIVMEPESDWYR